MGQRTSFFVVVFKILFLSSAKSDYREEKKQSGRSSNQLFSHPQVTTMACAVPIRSQEPENSSRSPTEVQGPKALVLATLLSQTTSRELDGKWSC